MARLDKKTLRTQLDALDDDDKETFVEVVTEWLPQDVSLTGAFKKLQEQFDALVKKVEGKGGDKKVPFWS
jgi:hypothetical protein